MFVFICFGILVGLVCGCLIRVAGLKRDLEYTNAVQDLILLGLRMMQKEIKELKKNKEV